MAKFANCNTIGTNNDPLWFFKLVLKQAGWTIKSSGTGTGGTYSASSDLIVNQSATAGGMGNARAWYVIEDPAGLRQFCMQNITSATNQPRIKFSKGTKFIGGSPNANTVPSAADEVVWYGGGTDASPSAGGFWPNSTSGNYRVHMVTYSTPVGGVYPIYCYFTVNGTGAQSQGMLVMDPLAPGSYDVLDPEPWVALYASATDTTVPGFYFNGTWVPVGVKNTIISAGTLITDVYSGKDVNVRPMYLFTGSTRIKGFGGYYAVKGPARVYPATVNSTTDAFVYLGSSLIPFADNTVPLL